MQNRKTRVAVISGLSIGVGFLYLFPHILFIRELGGEYWGFVLLGSPDKEFYLSLVREALDGHWLLASPFLFEHKDVGFSAFPFLGVWIAALPGLMGLSIGAITVFWDFAAPAAAFALACWAYRRAGLGAWTALAAALTALTAPYLLALEPAMYAVVEKHPRSHGFYFFLPMMRTINPQQSALVFLAAMGAWVGVVDRRSITTSWGARTIITAILMFLLSLTNLYFATFLITLSFIWRIPSLLDSKFKTRGIFHLLAALAGAAGLGVIAINLLILKARLGALHPVNLVKSHLPMIGSGEIVMLALSTATWLLSRHKGRRDAAGGAPTMQLSVAISIAYAVCMNQQIFTGFMLQSWHYELYVAQFLLPLNFFIFIEAAWEQLREVEGRVTDKGFKPLVWVYNIAARIRRSGVFLMAGWMIICVADGLIEQTWGYRQMHKPYAMASRILREPIQWLRENAHRDAVVMADPLNTARFIPMYSSQNVLASLGASEFPVPSPKEMRVRLMWNLAGMGLTPQEFDALALPDDSTFHFAFFSRRRSNPATGRSYTEWRLPPLTQADLQSVSQNYADIYANYNLSNMPYRLDYCLRGFYEERAYPHPWKVEQFCNTSQPGNNWSICRVYKP